MPTLSRTTSSNLEFQALVKLLDADLKIRDGEEHSFFAQFNKIDAINEVVVAFQNNVAVGCGAFKPFNKTSVEIKRMYVLPEYRGMGIAQSVLQELEKWAAELGYQYCVLETGMKQPEAIRLYEKSGYHQIPNYGQYENVATSVCFRKELR
jgi:GNAT superfamily N-acetyltransferase